MESPSSRPPHFLLRSTSFPSPNPNNPSSKTPSSQYTPFSSIPQATMASQSSVALRPPVIQTLTGNRMRARSVTATDNADAEGGISSSTSLSHSKSNSGGTSMTKEVKSTSINPNTNIQSPLLPIQSVLLEEDFETSSTEEVEVYEESELDDLSAEGTRRSSSSSSESSSPIPSHLPDLISNILIPHHPRPAKHLALTPKPGHNFNADDDEQVRTSLDETDFSSVSSNYDTPPTPFLSNLKPTTPFPFVIQAPSPLASPSVHPVQIPKQKTPKSKPQELVLDIANTPSSISSPLQNFTPYAPPPATPFHSDDQSFVLPPTPTTGSFSPSLLPSQLLQPPAPQVPKYSLLPSIAVLVGVFVTSLIFVASLTLTLPSLFIPHNLKDVLKILAGLEEYRAGGWLERGHVLLVCS
jgi:hypothetical protein